MRREGVIIAGSRRLKSIRAARLDDHRHATIISYASLRPAPPMTEARHGTCLPTNRYSAALLELAERGRGYVEPIPQKGSWSGARARRPDHRRGLASEVRVGPAEVQRSRPQGTGAAATLYVTVEPVLSITADAALSPSL